MTRKILLLPLVWALSGCGPVQAEASGAARVTFVVYLLFMVGIFFVGDYSVGLLRKWKIADFLKRHLRKLYAALFILGAPVTLVALSVALIAGYGPAEAYGISWIILGLSFVLSSLCVKRWGETDDDLWLRRVVQILYIGLICFVSITTFIQA